MRSWFWSITITLLGSFFFATEGVESAAVGRLRVTCVAGIMSATVAVFGSAGSVGAAIIKVGTWCNVLRPCKQSCNVACDWRQGHFDHHMHAVHPWVVIMRVPLPCGRFVMTG